MSDENSHARALWDELPPRDDIEGMMDDLDREGLREFSREVLDVVYANGHDPRFGKIIHAWHRSLRFLTSPGFRERLASLHAPGRP